MRTTPRWMIVVLACVLLSAACGGGGIYDFGGGGAFRSDPYEVDYRTQILITNQTANTYDSYDWSQSGAPPVILAPPLAPGGTRTIVMEGTVLCTQVIGPCEWGWTFTFYEEATGQPSADQVVRVEEPGLTATLDIGD